MITEKQIKKMQMPNAQKYIAGVLDRLIPKGRVSDTALIISFEKIDREFTGEKAFQLFDCARLLNPVTNSGGITKHPDFDRFNSYFKKVHGIIRKRAEKSPLYEECIKEVLLVNYEKNTGWLFNKNDGLKAYKNTLDEYDPNKNQTKTHYNWNGFWSTIVTKNGKITGIYLGDTADRDIFFSHIPKCAPKWN